MAVTMKIAIFRILLKCLYPIRWRHISEESKFDFNSDSSSNNWHIENTQLFKIHGLFFNFDTYPALPEKK
jgi:hypothetical protein